MATQAQTIIKRILVFNKLLSEADADKLLNQIPDPEQAVKKLVDMKVIPANTANQLLGIYRKQMAQVKEQGAGAGKPPGAPPGAAPKAGQAPGAARPAPGTRAHVQAGGGGKALILKLLKAASDFGASDMHIKSGTVPVARVLGQLRDMKIDPIPREVCEAALLDILSPEQKEKFMETKDLDFCFDGGELGRFRTNFLYQQRGIDGIFRLIPKTIPSFDELQIPETVRKFVDYRTGIVLVTGPKGCGKTTTLAAMVDYLNTTREEHIITIEDPIEFIQPCKKGHVNQREVGAHTQSFSNALRAALREAPDVIMVGEMRDLETTSLAITAAETGHLVLATLHTPNAIRTIGRVLDVFPPKEQGQIRAMISESLRGIASQLLVPGKDGKSVHLAMEILVNTPAVGNLIRDDRTFQLRGVMQTGKKLGMQLMDESLIRLAVEGKIRPEEALSRCEDEDFVKNELSKAGGG